MTRLPRRSTAICGAGSLLLGAAASACPTGSAHSLSAAVQAANSGCLTGCIPSDCGESRPVLPGSADSSGRGGFPFVIEMAKFAFLPDSPIIRPNTTVRWDNTSLFSQHTSTRLPTWDSGLVNPGDFFDFTFTGANAGLSYHYECTIHFGMEGDINVAHFGDANLDGIVNLQDFNILAANFGSTSGVGWNEGDFNEDGVVNLQDFNLLAGSFGREIQPASFTLDIGGFVPESGMMCLLAPTLIALQRRRKSI